MILLAFYGLILYNKPMMRISCFTSLCLCFCISFAIKNNIADGVSYAYAAPVEDSNVENNYTIHIVENGDNLYRIGLKYKLAQKEIIELNNISNNHIFVGQKLKIPVKKDNTNHAGGDSKPQFADGEKEEQPSSLLVYRRGRPETFRKNIYKGRDKKRQNRVCRDYCLPKKTMIESYEQKGRNNPQR